MAGLAVLAAVGCGSSSPAEPSDPAPSDDARIEAKLRRTPNALKIGYQLRNTSEKPLVVFNGLPASETHDPKPDPQSVYVATREDGTVEIAKRLFPPPEGVGLAVYYALRGSTLGPGATIGERLSIPLPLRPRRPYEDASEKPIRLPDDLDRLAFCVGVARKGAIDPQPHPGKRPLFVHSEAGARAQQLVCSKSEN